MTSRYSHGGYGWNQQLRYAVTLFHTALLSYGVSYGRSADDATLQLKVANAPKDEGKNWWSQRDLNPCFNPTMISPLFLLGLDDFLNVRKGHD